MQASSGIHVYSTTGGAYQLGFAHFLLLSVTEGITVSHNREEPTLLRLTRRKKKRRL